MVVSQQEMVLKCTAHLRLTVLAVLLWLSLPAAAQEMPSVKPALPASSQAAPAAAGKAEPPREDKAAGQERKPKAPARAASPERSDGGRKPAPLGLCDGS